MEALFCFGMDREGMLGLGKEVQKRAIRFGVGL